MKKFLAVLLTLFCFVPSVLMAEEKEKVKVYIFEAGECPYCEAEINYLEGLKSYEKKFEIVRKELYVDHETFAKGKDYKLGLKLSKAFKKAGFENADYKATPFVIISDVYATTGYSDELESYIDEAYEKGDKDIVGCAINGEKCTIGETEFDFKNSEGSLGLVFAVLAGFALLITLFLMFSSKQTNEFEENELDEMIKKEVKKATPKKVTTKAVNKTETTKKTVNKKPTKKNTTKRNTKK